MLALDKAIPRGVAAVQGWITEHAARPVYEADAARAHRYVQERSQRGFVELGALGVVTAGAIGLVAAGPLNLRIEARPLGRYVPPSAAGAVLSLVGYGLARHAKRRKTATAALGLGLGLGLGTLTSARRPGGLLFQRRA